MGEPELADICTQLARQVEEMAETYENPTSLQIGTIQNVNAGDKMHRGGGVKMHQRGWQEGPPRGAFLRFAIRFGWRRRGCCEIAACSV